MHIPLPTSPIPAMWEGELESASEVRTYHPILKGPGGGVRASIGQPFQWADGQLLGEDWQPPQGSHRYHLLRLSFTLRLFGPRTKIQNAVFCLTIHPQGSLRGVAFDAFPKEHHIEDDHEVTLSLGPTFKFGTAEAEIAGAEVKVDAGRVVPVVIVEGLQENELCWHYRPHRKYPLRGSRLMHAVVALPPGMDRALATLQLRAELQDEFGRMPMGVPFNEQEHLRFTIGS